MKITILLFLLLLLSKTYFGQNEFNTDLIAHYPLDGNAIDISGNDLHGNLIGTQPSLDRFGNFGGAIFFNGENDFINLGSSYLLKPFPPITIATWIKYTEVPAVIWGNDFHETIYYGISFLINQNSKIAMSYCNGINIGPYSRRTVTSDIDSQNQWVHITGTIDLNYNMRLFINGSEVEVEHVGYADTLVYSDGPAVFGKLDSQTYGPPYYLEGSLDDFRLYNRVLTDEEIEALVDGWNPSQNFLFSIDKVLMDNPDLVEVPVHLTIPENKSLTSFEVDIEGFRNDLYFLNLSLDESEVLTSDWQISINNTINGISIAGATDLGSSETQSGLLFQLNFSVHQPILENKIVPLNATTVIVNNNASIVQTTNGSVTILSDEITYGDVDLDGQVRALDASYILEYLTGGIDFNDFQFIAADVTLDSTISGLDAQLILDFITNKIPELPYIPDSNLVSFEGEFYMEDLIAGYSEVVEIPVYLNTNSTLFSIEGDIEFDTNDFELIYVRLENNYSDFLTNISYENGRISFVSIGQISPDSDSLLTLFLRKKNYVDKTEVSLTRIRINETNPRFQVASSTINIVTDVENEITKFDFSLGQNYPNPFNSHTTISFVTPESGNVTLEIYDILGRKIATLINAFMPAGNHEIKFNSEELNSGLYFYRIISAQHRDTKKMVLMK